MTQAQPRTGGSVNTPHIGDKLPRRNNRFMRWLGTTCLKLLGWRFEGDLPNIPKLLAIGAPHTSTWDVVIAVMAFFAIDVRLSFMAKHTLFWWPFGIFMRWVGAVPIERHKKIGVVEQTINQYEQRDQFVIALSPEGTRSKVSRLKTGFYHIAVGAKVPIVCVGIDFGRKTIIFNPIIMPSGNLEADLKAIRELFKNVTAKHPERSSFL